MCLYLAAVNVEQIHHQLEQRLIILKICTHLTEIKSFLTSSSSNVTPQSKPPSSFISTTSSSSSSSLLSSIYDNLSSFHQQPIDFVAADVVSNKHKSSDEEQEEMVEVVEKLNYLPYWSDIDDLFKTYYSDQMARNNAKIQQSQSQYAHASIKYVVWFCEKGKVHSSSSASSTSWTCFPFLCIICVCIVVQVIVLTFNIT